MMCFSAGRNPFMRLSCANSSKMEGKSFPSAFAATLALAIELTAAI